MHRHAAIKNGLIAFRPFPGQVEWLERLMAYLESVGRTANPSLVARAALVLLQKELGQDLNGSASPRQIARRLAELEAQAKF